ncbi:hypothetical protein F442_16436, partial [Phytophthora nicotianae P10297]
MAASPLISPPQTYVGDAAPRSSGIARLPFSSASIEFTSRKSDASRKKAASGSSSALDGISC